MLTVADVAKRLRCSPSLVYALCAAGKLQHHRLGLGRGTLRVTEAQLGEFLAGTAITPAPPQPEELRHIRLPS